MRLYIRNMVCNRCKLVINQELEKMGLHPTRTELGEVELAEKELNKTTTVRLKEKLEELGFELIDDKKSRLIEKIKTLVIELVHHAGERTNLKNSEYIAGELQYDYSYLSKLFSEVEGITIEQFLILQKIEKVKEMLVYDELSLSEIADRLGYSSVAHLSAQFKKITGLTPSFYKNKSVHLRKPIDEIGKS